MQRAVISARQFHSPPPPPPPPIIEQNCRGLSSAILLYTILIEVKDNKNAFQSQAATRTYNTSSNFL